MILEIILAQKSSSMNFMMSQVIEDDIKLEISKYLIIWRVVYP